MAAMADAWLMLLFNVAFKWFQDEHGAIDAKAWLCLAIATCIEAIEMMVGLGAKVGTMTAVVTIYTVMSSLFLDQTSFIHTYDETLFIQR